MSDARRGSVRGRSPAGWPPRAAVALTLALLALLALAGCATVLPNGGDPPAGEDPIGWEGGYAADASLDVTTADGLNESERAAVFARTKARVEAIRQQEFDGNVSLEVISRAEFANRSTGLGVEPSRWNDQVWEGLFLVGEQERAHEALGETLAGSVQGYYDSDNESIVLVSDSPTPTVDRATLAHELLHALQDQHGSLGREVPTQDRQLAQLSLVEGEANLVRNLYEQRCRGAWRCLDRPPGGSGGSASDGVFLVVFQPYATGPAFVQRARERGGWAAVDALHDRPPNSTEQVLHAGAYPDEAPVNVTVPDRSGAGWKRFDHDPVAETVGETSIYATFVANGVTDPADRYEYHSAPSAGWGGDALVPYRQENGENAYVWRTAWDTTTDAREFARAYRDLLDRRDATARGDGVYVLPADDPFTDAFRVRRDGRRVTVVNAPSADELDDVHARAG